MFVTFYSYKGGVGRSLALANIACLMAEDQEHSQRILLWDFDLEAPGLHKLFPPKEPQNYGFIDFAYTYAISKEVPNIEDYIYESEVEGVYVLPAGRLGKSYCEKLRRIDWLRFFGSDLRDPGPFFGKIMDSLKNISNPFDYVLIDSRTGLNDQAGICTQVLSDLLVILFRLSVQNLDGLEHLVPAIKSQLKARHTDDVQILPIASQVGTASSQSMLELRKKAVKIFGSSLEYIRFDEGLVSEEKLFSRESEIEQTWPIPPIVDDYKRICATIRNSNKSDTRTETSELVMRMRQGDYASASSILLSLLPRRPRLSRAWNTLERLLDSKETRKDEFKKVVSKVLRKDKENYYAYEWQAAFQASGARNPDSPQLKKARNALRNALKYCPDTEKGRICQSLARIESCQGNHRDAINAFRKAQSFLPDNRQINLDLAMLHMRMGGKYFATAAEELDQIPSEIGDEKYVALAYLRAFLGEGEKASEALKECGKNVKALAKAYILLIEGDKKGAVEIGEKKISAESEPGELANWTELLLCSGEFEKAVRAINGVKSRKTYEADLSPLQKLAEFLRVKEHDYSEESKKLISDWNQKSWNFRELLIFREICNRGGIDYGGRLGIIEQLIQFQEMREIKSPLRLITGRSRLKIPKLRIEYV